MFFVKSDREELLNYIYTDEELKSTYENLSMEFKESYLSFCCGEKGLTVLYDFVFKSIFNPTDTPDRLEKFLGALFNQKVKIKQVLPLEGNRIVSDINFTIFDIVVELEDESLVNVEIQKRGYCFPGQRASCYSSDLMMRQYTRIKSRKEKKFSYRDLKKVITIVIEENSTKEFKKLPKSYIHRSRQIFDTGLELDLLQEFMFIPLDIFKKLPYTIDKEVDAWLHFLISDEPEIILDIIKKYPMIEEMYEQIFSMRNNPKEVLHMFSKELYELDRNTAMYMVEEAVKEKEEAVKEREEALKEKDQVVKEKDQVVKEKDQIIQEKDQVAKEKEKEINELKDMFEKQAKQIEELTRKIQELTNN